MIVCKTQYVENDQLGATCEETTTDKSKSSMSKWSQTKSSTTAQLPELLAEGKVSTCNDATGSATTGEAKGCLPWSPGTSQLATAHTSGLLTKTGLTGSTSTIFCLRNQRLLLLFLFCPNQYTTAPQGRRRVGWDLGSLRIDLDGQLDSSRLPPKKGPHDNLQQSNHPV